MTREQFENFWSGTLSGMFETADWAIDEAGDRLHELANYIATLPGILWRLDTLGPWEILLIQTLIMGLLAFTIFSKNEPQSVK